MPECRYVTALRLARIALLVTPIGVAAACTRTAGSPMPVGPASSSAAPVGSASSAAPTPPASAGDAPSSQPR